LAERADGSAKPHSEESLCYSTQIHDVTGALEDRVKEKFPQIALVTFHLEPVEER
jgi:divalent metal cation (Fe/Co/Zn/Cd) transporter